MEAATDAALHVRVLLAEMLYHHFTPGRSGELHPAYHRLLATTDCKSLYDTLIKDGPRNSLSEKRRAVDIVGLQDIAGLFDEENPASTFRWIPGNTQCADGMTKTMATYKLREILQRCRFSLKEATDQATGDNRRHAPLVLVHTLGPNKSFLAFNKASVTHVPRLVEL